MTIVAASARPRSRRKSDRYLVASDAPATVRAYTADGTHFSKWCAARDLVPMPASPALVGDYLSDLGEGYARLTLRRKVAAVAQANRHAGHRLDTKHPCIRDVLRGSGRTHGGPPQRAQALATEEIQRLVAACNDSVAGLRDRARLLVAFAGALRRSKLCSIEMEHITWHPRSFELLIPRSKTNAENEGARIVIPRGKAEATCPVRALRAWLDAAGIEHGPVFGGVTRQGTLRAGALTGEAVRKILLKRPPWPAFAAAGSNRSRSTGCAPAS